MKKIKRPEKGKYKGGWVAFPDTKIKIAVAAEAGFLEEMGIDWDFYQYLANVHFKHNEKIFSIFNVRVVGDYGYAKNKDGDWVLVIELDNKLIHKIEKVKDIGKDFDFDENIICLN